MSESPRIRVAALMLIDDKVVVVRHRKERREYHLLPGGGVEFGETLACALQREVAEETGLTCDVQHLLIVHDSIDPNGARHVVNIVFACRVQGGELCTAPDDARVVGVELVEPETLAELDLRPPLAEELIAALRRPQEYPAHYAGSTFSPERITGAVQSSDEHPNSGKVT